MVIETTKTAVLYKPSISSTLLIGTSDSADTKDKRFFIKNEDAAYFITGHAPDEVLSAQKLLYWWKEFSAGQSNGGSWVGLCGGLVNITIGRDNIIIFTHGFDKNRNAIYKAYEIGNTSAHDKRVSLEVQSLLEEFLAFAKNK